MIKLQEYGKYVLLNGRNKGRGVVLRTLVLMSCILLGSLLHAQNNPYGIKDQLYPLYNNAYKSVQPTRDWCWRSNCMTMLCV